MSREFGDFQTPPELVRQVIDVLKRRRMRWSRILEPTCGVGEFLRGCLELRPSEIIGIELQEPYAIEARSHLTEFEGASQVINANLFDIDLRSLQWKTAGSLLVIGNPPWVTNSELGALSSANVPPKKNLKALIGIEAKTGSANFDLAESIILTLIRELPLGMTTVAFLCKTAVARAVVHYAATAQLPVANARARRIDAKKFFGAAVEACLFEFEMAQSDNYELQIYESLDAVLPEVTAAVINGKLVADAAAYSAASFADGSSPIAWRQGLKHDAAQVMELELTSTGWVNGLDEVVEVEPEFVFPLKKATTLFRGEAAAPHRGVLVPQRTLGDRTEGLRYSAPRLWEYLQKHRSFFEQRRSSIYRKRGPFAVFGIGPYSFAPYRVAVSGLHKTARFRALGPVEGKPVMVDDTCYQLPCSSPEQAAFLEVLLNGNAAQRLLKALVFTDAKRPLTKAVLHRIDLRKILDAANRTHIVRDAETAFKALCPNGEPKWPASLESLLQDQSEARKEQLPLVI